MLKFLTGNKGKFLEMQAALAPVPLKQVRIDLEEIQGLDRRKIIEHKLEEAFKHHGSNFLIEDVSFYLPFFAHDNLKLVLNRDHSFYQKVYQPLVRAEPVEPSLMLEHLQLLLLAAARAECSMKSKEERMAAEHLRHSWSNTLTAFLD